MATDRIRSFAGAFGVIFFVLILPLVFGSDLFGSEIPDDLPIPKDVSSYGDGGLEMGDQLSARIEVLPFNLVAGIIFLLAIVHTFFASFFLKLSHDVQHRHTQKLIRAGTIGTEHKDVSFLARLLHFFGEVEAVFGIWVIALVVAICLYFDWSTAKYYLLSRNYTEPMFVVVIMALSSTRPILNFSENCLKKVANFGKGTVAAWWLTILTLGPLLGSLITEPAAITISALLLGKQFYAHKPSSKFMYATIGLLFTNISVGGTMTNFAAPPVLMVAAKWEWSSMFMLTHFGWKAALGIIVSNMLYFFYFKKEFAELQKAKQASRLPEVEVTSSDGSDLVPGWVTMVHILFMLWTVIFAHYPVLFIGGFIFFLGFLQMTPQHQNRLELTGPMLVGFFLAGLVIHGGLQGWWIQPLLGSMSANPLLVLSAVLTSFNDNAAITLLSTLVPNFSPELKYAVVAGAVTGGGLTFIANAPNPAGKSILTKFFPGQNISPLGLLFGAITPTIIIGVIYAIL